MASPCLCFPWVGQSFCHSDDPLTWVVSFQFLPTSKARKNTDAPQDNEHGGDDEINEQHRLRCDVEILDEEKEERGDKDIDHLRVNNCRKKSASEKPCVSSVQTSEKENPDPYREKNRKRRDMEVYEFDRWHFEIANDERKPKRGRKNDDVA